MVFTIFLLRKLEKLHCAWVTLHERKKTFWLKNKDGGVGAHGVA